VLSGLNNNLPGNNTPLIGMLVYNTNPDLGTGIYCWTGTQWVKIPDQDNNTTYSAGDGLTLNGTTLSITDKGVTTGKIADSAVTEDKLEANAVTTAKILNENVTLDKLDANSVNSKKIVNGSIAADDLSAMGASDGQILKYDGTTWAPVSLSVTAYSGRKSSAPCTGAIVFGGAYDGPGTAYYFPNFAGPFEPNWSTPEFHAQNKDLCWALTDAGPDLTRADARNACANLNLDGRRWRLPNMKELQVLYEALGGNGTTVGSFGELSQSGYGLGNEAVSKANHPQIDFKQPIGMDCNTNYQQKDFF
jgi:hypothetical protein